MELAPLMLIEMVCEASWRLARHTCWERGELTRVVHARIFEFRHIQWHLIKRGFMEGYLRWTKHGEDEAIVSDDDIITDEEANDTPFDIDLDPDDHMSNDADSGPDLEQMLRDFEGQGTDTAYEQC